MKATLTLSIETTDLASVLTPYETLYSLISEEEDEDNNRYTKLVIETESAGFIHTLNRTRGIVVRNSSDYHISEVKAEIERITSTLKKDLEMLTYASSMKLLEFEVNKLLTTGNTFSVNMEVKL